MKKILTSRAALNEIGSRLKSYRIDALLTQDDLAIKSGVSRRSIQNLEKGNDVKFETLIKVLMALDLDSNLDMLVPDPTARPSYYLHANDTLPQRVRKSKIKKQNVVFKWGDEK